MKASILPLAVLLAWPAVAQHAGHHGHAAASAYAGEQSRAIKALSPDEQRAWIEGEGMGLAKAAELNGYPGPTHVLELAGPLELSPQQAAATRELMQRHKAQVRALGLQLVEAERQLDAAFRDQRATDAEVARLTAGIGELQARIRASHLQTHLAQTGLLTREQVARYARLRGYAPP